MQSTTEKQHTGIYIFKLVRALWLELEFKVIFVAKLLRDLSPKLKNFITVSIVLVFTLK